MADETGTAGDSQVIHLLRLGLALCGKPGVPGAWEPGHSWVAADDETLLQLSAANCAGCLLVVSARQTALATRLADALREQIARAERRPRRKKKPPAPDPIAVTDEQLTHWRVLAHGWASANEVITLPRGMVGRIVLRLLDTVVSSRGSVAIAQAKALDATLIKLHGEPGHEDEQEKETEP